MTKPERLFLPREQLFPPTLFVELKLRGGPPQNRAALTELWSTSKQRGFNRLGLQRLRTLGLCVCTLGGTSLNATLQQVTLPPLIRLSLCTVSVWPAVCWSHRQTAEERDKPFSSFSNQSIHFVIKDLSEQSSFSILIFNLLFSWKLWLNEASVSFFSCWRTLTSWHEFEDDSKQFAFQNTGSFQKGPRLRTEVNKVESETFNLSAWSVSAVASKPMKLMLA